MNVGHLYVTLSRHVRPILIVFGTIGALLNLALFHFQKVFRKNSCALYFRARSINDLCVLCYVMLFQWLRDQFNMDPATQYHWYCKVSNYLMYTLYTLSPYFVVLACFDRLCTSSTNAKVRRLASVKTASILIPCVIGILSLFFVYLLVGSEIVSSPMGTGCILSTPIYDEILLFSIGFFYCFLPLLLMIIFKCITVILLRRQRNRVMPVNLACARRRDNQLLRMLSIYVVWNIICIAPFSIVYFIQLQKSDDLSPLADPLVGIFNLLANCTYASSFYIYTLATPFYRAELCKLLHKCFRRIHRFKHRNEH